MRALVVFVLSALMLLVPRPGPAGAQDVTTFKSPEFGILFDYPSGWTVGPGERRGLLPNEVFDVRASPDPLTAYSVAVYYLNAPIPDASLPSAITSLDARVVAWIARLPAGDLVGRTDVDVYGAPARAYEYRYRLAGERMHAAMIVVPWVDQVYQIDQWARDAEYDDLRPLFDAISSNLILPWTT